MTKGNKQMTKVEYKRKQVSRNEECGKGCGCGRVAENCGGVAEGCGMEWECGRVTEECGTECPPKASHTPLKLMNCHACPASHRAGDESACENVKFS